MNNKEMASAFVGERPEFAGVSSELREQIAEACLNFAFKFGERHINTRRNLEAKLDRYREGMERGLYRVVKEREKAIQANQLLQDKIEDSESLRKENIRLVQAIAQCVRHYSGPLGDLRDPVIQLPAHLQPLLTALRECWSKNS